MIKDKTQNQESGDNSANYQAETINQYGLSYSEVKEVALDVFKNNFISLSEQANQLARIRAEELVDNFLNEIKNKNADLLISVQEPSMQNALYSAQKSYAISGNKDTAELLIDILVERAEQKERNLKQIVLDECLEVAPKLTINQLNVLSIVFLMLYSVDETIIDLNTLKQFLDKNVRPFVPNLSKELSSYQHLEYCNCSSTSSMQFASIEHIFVEAYKGIFNFGCPKPKFEATFDGQELPTNFIVPSFYDNSNIRINVINNEDLEQKLTSVSLPEEVKDIIRNIFNNGAMKTNKVKEILLNQGDYMKEFFEIWDNSEMPRMNLTSVGIALGNANLKRVTGEDYDLSLWII